MEGNSDFIFTFFNKFDGDAIHSMGFFGIEFVNDADNVRDTNIYLSEGVESEEGRLGRYDAVRGEGFTAACKQLIKAFRLFLEIRDKRAICNDGGYVCIFVLFISLL